MLIAGFCNAAIFAYLGGATYVLQGIYGLSPQGYSLAFGLNSLGFMLFGFLAGRLAERWSEHGMLIVGLLMCLTGAGGLVLGALARLPLLAVCGSLFLMVSGVAATTPSTTSLAMAEYPQLAGTAASLLGVARFAFGAVDCPAGRARWRRDRRPARPRYAGIDCAGHSCLPRTRPTRPLDGRRRWPDRGHCFVVFPLVQRRCSEKDFRVGRPAGYLTPRLESSARAGRQSLSDGRREHRLRASWRTPSWYRT